MKPSRCYSSPTWAISRRASAFRIQAGGVTYYLTKLQLQAHETRAINLRKLRDAQQPDFQKNMIPAGATDGSVAWVRIDNVPVMGRLVMVQGHKGLANNYDADTEPLAATTPNRPPRPGRRADG